MNACHVTLTIKLKKKLLRLVIYIQRKIKPVSVSPFYKIRNKVFTTKRSRLLGHQNRYLTKERSERVDLLEGPANEPIHRLEFKIKKTMGKKK